jgi:hypothetical protein
VVKSRVLRVLRDTNPEKQKKPTSENQPAGPRRLGPARCLGLTPPKRKSTLSSRTYYTLAEDMLDLHHRTQLTYPAYRSDVSPSSKVMPYPAARSCPTQQQGHAPPSRQVIHHPEHSVCAAGPSGRGPGSAAAAAPQAARPARSACAPRGRRARTRLALSALSVHPGYTDDSTCLQNRREVVPKCIALAAAPCYDTARQLGATRQWRSR